jgi:enoyl-CoA hydratase/carnithine racemase
MMDSPVIYAVEGALARVTLNRPEKRNALNDELVAGLKESLRDADARDDVRAVLLAGAGADFCSGADLSALRKISEGDVSVNFEDARSRAGAGWRPRATLCWPPPRRASATRR